MNRHIVPALLWPNDQSQQRPPPDSRGASGSRDAVAVCCNGWFGSNSFWDDVPEKYRRDNDHCDANEKDHKERDVAGSEALLVALPTPGAPAPGSNQMLR